MFTMFIIDITWDGWYCHMFTMWKSLAMTMVGIVYPCGCWMSDHWEAASGEALWPETKKADIFGRVQLICWVFHGLPIV